jgi:ABC-2 type transport system permease protein
MTTTSDSTAGSRVIRVAVAQRGFGTTYRATRIVFRREVIRFFNDRMRIFSAMIQPVLFLLVLGTGLSVVSAGSLGGISLRAIMFPGVLAMAVLFTAVFAAGSIGWDREFGFLREMLVAPVSRGSIIAGKVAGGAATAALQGIAILVLAGLADVPYHPLMLLELVGEIALFAFALASFGAMLAARMKSVQAFMAVTQMTLMPLFFTSGALFPLSGLPLWLKILTWINPLTYAVDPIRRTVFANLDLSDAVRATYAGGVRWGGWQLPLGLELVVVLGLGCVMLWAAILRFRKAE